MVALLLKWLISNWRETLLGALILFLVSSNAVYRLEAHNCAANLSASQAQVTTLSTALDKQNKGVKKLGDDQKQVATQAAAAVTQNKAQAAGIKQANQKTLNTKIGDTCTDAMNLLRDSASSF